MADRYKPLDKHLELCRDCGAVIGTLYTLTHDRWHETYPPLYRPPMEPSDPDGRLGS